MTGVVGPNGCGKSNIVDAIRWVMGEQSPKQLRGQTMEDLIFAGNDRHPPLGFAEVSVVFDNEGRLSHLRGGGEEDGEEPAVAAVLRDAPEIEVRRRVYRSGESEYFLNGRPCRLRDITDLFLGSGVGNRAYSIIEQGRVVQLVNAKPEDLRIFIEEAAGTTLYRSRKQAAERKIERTRDNLLRVNDIIHELERQASSLKRQARGAVRYQELKAREAELDAALTGRRLRELASAIERQTETLAGLQATEADLRRTIEEGEEQAEQVRAARLLIEQRLEAGRKDTYERRAALSALEQEKRFLLRRREELDRRIEEAAAEERAIAEKIAERTAETEQIRIAVEALGPEVEVLAERRNRLEQQREGSESKLAGTEEQLEQCKSQLTDLLSRRASLLNEQGTLGRQREAGERRAARLREERESLEALARQLGEDVECCRRKVEELVLEVEATAGGKESVAARLAELMSRKTEAARRAESLRNEAAQVRSKFESLKELHEKFEGYGDGVKSLMNNGWRQQAGATAVVADVIEIEEGYEAAVAAVLQDRLQCVVVPDAQIGIRGARYLKETGGGRASFIPRQLPGQRSGEAVPQGYSMLAEHVRAKEGYDAVVGELVQGVAVAANLEEASQGWERGGQRLTFVTPDGEVLDARGVITGGSGRPIDEEILARKVQLRHLRTELIGVEERARGAAERLEQLERETRRADEELAGLDRRIHELTVARVESEGDLELHRQNLTRTCDRLSTVEAELESAEREDVGLRTRLREIASELEKTAAAQSRLEEERRKVEEMRAATAAELARLREGLEELRVEEVQLRQRRETAQQRLQELRLAIDELGGRREVLARQIEECEAERASVRERLASPDLELESRRRELASAEQAVEGLVVDEQAAGGWLRAAEARVRALRRDLEELREQRGVLEVRVKELELEHRSIADAARERLGRDPGDVAAAESQEADAALEQELQRVRNSIRRIGTVNLGAVQELEEIEQRLGELVSQRDDLEKSIEDLRGTIARLNRLSRRRFRETFEAVNELFKKTFPHMFHGGQAWLALTDENNLLETGVEIFVRPPGKRVGNLNLLSGGEKALTAVSLIFSLFLYKPSPFCILDEVDAPLDDANIGRFSRMIRDMSDRSQFVLITHNKRTMEACDVLYGVTMGEPGVSKVVSVELPS